MKIFFKGHTSVRATTFRFYLLQVFLILFFYNLSQAFVAQVVDQGNLKLERLDDCLDKNFLVKKITYNSDVFIQPKEFYYLLGLKEESEASLNEIKKGCWYLRKKNKFESITITINDQQNGKSIHFDLVGSWVCGKIKFHGPLAGKEIYQQYYVGEQGEKFENQKHLLGIQQMERALKDDGYCSAKVSNYLDYEYKIKTIHANIVFQPGKRFRNGDITFQANGEKKSSYATQAWIKKIEKIFYPRLKKAYYSKTLINKETHNLKQYLHKKGFLNASIKLHEAIHYEDRKVSLTFIITLNTKRTFVFLGNHFFSKEKLLDKILVFGSSAYFLPLSLLAEEIAQAYAKKGFLYTRIDTRQEDERYFFLIQEGVRVKINDIILDGVCSFDPRSLVRYCFGPLRKGLHFDGDILKKGLSYLIEWYNKQGFWDVKILKQTYLPGSQPEYQDIQYIVEEGKRRYYAGALVDGFPNLSKAAPFFKSSRKNVPFDLTFVQEQKQWLINYFQKQGYWDFEVYPEFQEEGQHVTVIWRIVLKSKQISFGKTVVLGTSTFPFDRVTRFIRKHEGNPWNKSLLEQSFDHLRFFDVFETIHPYADVGDEQGDEKAVMLKLVEDDPFEVRLRGGFQQVSKNLTFRNGSTYKIGGSFTYKNPGNVGDCFVCEGDATRFYNNITASYFRPLNFNKTMSVIVKAYNTIYIQPVFIGSDKSLYKAWQQGFLIGIARKYVPVDWGINIGMEWFKTDVLSFKLAEAINFSPTLVDKKIPYFYVEPNLFIDYLDDQLNPGSGFLTVFSCKGMLPYDRKGVAFLKILFEQSYFFSIARCTFGFRARMGHIFNGSFARVMPSDRFYLGGENSLRAYSPNMAPPLGKYIDEKGKCHLVPQGGKSMFNGNFEIRFPLFKNIHGGIFQDVGILVEKAFSAVRGGTWLAATGFGIRYHTPIGPLRFDIGWKWRKAELEDSSFACFLTLGHAF